MESSVASRVDGADAGRRLAPVLARWRRELAWTQDELAARAGISRGYISRLERGLPGRPGLEVLSRLCAAMGRGWPALFVAAGLSLPGDLTLDEVADGLDDPELMLYLRRLPELGERDRAILRAVLRACFERPDDGRLRAASDARQLALPPLLAERHAAVSGGTLLTVPDETVTDSKEVVDNGSSMG